MENKTKNRHVTIQEWMLDYDLSPTELICFAIIFGFSQDGKSKYQGSSSYLSMWTKTSRATVFSALKKLCEMNLIVKEEKTVNGVKLCDYRVVQNFNTLSKNHIGVIKNLDGGYQNFCLHNIEDNIEDNNKTDNTSMSSCQMTPAKKASIEADKIAELFNSTCVSLAKVKLLSKSRMSQVEARLKELKQAPETYVSFLQELFARIERSDFLTNRNGLNRNNWRATFDWIFAPRNFLKVIEGNYDNKGANAIPSLSEPDGWQVYFIKTYTTEPLPASWEDVPESKKITILKQVNK